MAMNLTRASFYKNFDSTVLSKTSEPVLNFDSANFIVTSHSEDIQIS